MAKPYFSIIITTYNNINTIKKTLDSVVNQTLNNDKYEIIVIDDQSTDGTMEILSAYNESNLKIYQLDENSGGPSQPRNKGIRESNGDYIYFLDGDDWLDLNVLETISLNYLHLDSDIIISKVIKDNDGKQSIHAKFMTIKENYNVNGNDIPYLYYYLGPSGKFIKRELIFKNNISFPLHITCISEKIKYFS
ncbi:glycosyltransferase family 2 protein [Staphylococcus devriesei]|uniref:glycosyltransferase family 2 protein n=1 Tax=Staphylococcus devriesei TaxID=586733 RepID=UPI001F1C9F9F|nr:glycosyltransferase family A protein [Staphylococcus devriesei]